ncbi:hypothetical protein HGM15179_018169 [Zosterops borbonicus]|uniref:RNase H type-1 domain-containing protein n=1 Tax=Zosterops borbonicus TaxID=364589 RepID=A0A8K1FZI1_9PASS|nr:hypothetical protein HGM15179_018169 [Zosterops borbonicus]
MIRQAGIRDWECRNSQEVSGEQKWPNQNPGWNAQSEEVEEADYNLLGRDMIIALSRNLIVKESQLVVSLYKLTTEDEGKIDTKELELRTTTAQNPAQFLFGEALEELTHNCAEVVEPQTKIRPDLEEKELEEEEKWFVDRSARVVEGKRKSGYAIVDGKSRKVVESRPLSASWSAQACELYAVLQALKRLKGKKGTIFTDSKYAFGMVPTFGKIWEERGLVSTRGKGLVHGEIIKQILEAIREPEAISIVHIRRH